MTEVCFQPLIWEVPSSFFCLILIMPVVMHKEKLDTSMQNISQKLSQNFILEVVPA